MAHPAAATARLAIATMTACLLSVDVPRANPVSLMLLSSTFQNGGTLPRSMVFNRMDNGANACIADGRAAGDQSPALEWRGMPPGTANLALVMYDATASFTHWGIANIPASAAGLPAGAGAPGRPNEITNDFGIAGYSGPCPPVGVAPDTHRYVITLYALSTQIELPGSAQFPANAETLDHALLAAARAGRILASASISGTYSAAR